MEQQQALVIPRSRSNDGVPRCKIAVITKDGFKGSGAVDFEENELIELLSGNSDWLIIRTTAFDESTERARVHFDPEILCIKRDNIVAWAISKLQLPSKIARVSAIEISL